MVISTMMRMLPGIWLRIRLTETLEPDDADAAGDLVANQADRDVGAGNDEGHSQSHDDNRLQLGGDGQSRTDAEDLQTDRVFIEQGVE
jgi:hypothetical protein